MKKNKVSPSLVIILIALVAVIIITTCLTAIGKNRMNETLYTILLDSNKALIVTVLLGTSTKVISNEIIRVKTNDKKMKRLGIHAIGEGKLDKRQTNIMFGGNGYIYPSELKFLFITGQAFIKHFRGHMLNAMKAGCTIKILIADPIKSRDYLERAERICKQDEPYIEQCQRVIEIIKQMQAEAKQLNYSGNILIRHYHDEYRYNFRIAKYFNPELGQTIRTWINFQPINRNAINQSLTVLGKFDEEYLKEEISRTDKESQSIVLSLDESFDALWDLYQ